MSKIIFGGIQPNPKEAKVWLTPKGEIKTWDGTKWIERSLSDSEPDDTQPSLINFTILDTEYQAEEGMTWGQFIYSSYNVNGFFEFEYHDSVLVATEKMWSMYKVVCVDAGDEVLVTDKIVPNYSYTVTDFMP